MPILVAIGAIVLPEMVRNGYPMRFGAGIITVAGSLGILMLPSIPKIVYAVSTNTSIGALFVAGLLPGTLLTIMLCVVTWYLARKRDYPRLQKASWADTWKTPRTYFGPLLSPASRTKLRSCGKHDGKNRVACGPML